MDNGVRVSSEINPESFSEIRELYEMIPIFHRDERSQSQDVKSEIWLKINGNWQLADTNFRETDLIRVDRFNGSVYVEFESPKYVKLSPDIWTSDYQTKSRARNIMVDLTGGCGNVQELINTTISYIIHIGGEECSSNDSGEVNDGDGDSGSGDEGDSDGDGEGDGSENFGWLSVYLFNSGNFTSTN